MRLWRQWRRGSHFRDVQAILTDMSDALTSLVFGIGFGGWLYAKLMKNTRNPRNSLIGAGIGGAAGFLVIFTIIKVLLGW